MKMNMIIGKKQIVLASLVLILGIAIYLNWQFANSDDALGVADILGGNTDDNYFANARLEKQKTRDAATETLAGLLEKTDLSAEEKASATAQALQTAQLMESETTIENLVKAKGFEDCIAYLDSENAKVVVKSEELDAAQAAQIKDIIVSETAVDPSNIVVTPVK